LLDIKYIRENPIKVQDAIVNRNSQAPLDEILRLDAEHKKIVQELDNLRHQRKTIARERTSEFIEHGRILRQNIQKLEEDERALKKELKNLLLEMPSIPQDSVPIGKDARSNVIVREGNPKPKFEFAPRPHWEITDKLGIIDFDRGVKLSGSRFYILKGYGALLQRALIAFMLKLHTTEHGYTEIYPPYMVKGEVMVGSGNLPKFADNLYHDVEEDYWFIPTAEVPLTNLHRDEIIPPGILPLYYTAYTACFRREKMSAGKDVRGIKRGHQFDKVEMYKFCEPNKSNDELEKMVLNAEEVCLRLGLSHRVIKLCTSDLGFASNMSYDIEVWAPGIAEWLEVSSCSNCGDFQARRANIRYRPDSDSRPDFAHTLNGSGLALPRVLIAIIENYQQANGSIVVPDPLRDFMEVDIIK
jgi:seryl-tRNA synthetase